MGLEQSPVYARTKEARYQNPLIGRPTHAVEYQIKQHQREMQEAQFNQQFEKTQLPLNEGIIYQTEAAE